jgi:hypothetical protein
VQLDDERGEFVVRGTFDHPYPTTNIMWAPQKSTFEKDLLATTGDYLRLWNVQDDGEVRLEALLNNVRAAGVCCAHGAARRRPVTRVSRLRRARSPSRGACFVFCVAMQNKSSEYCAPLTSFDWNDTDPTMIGTSSIDTTCTIWDLTVRVSTVAFVRTCCAQYSALRVVVGGSGVVVVVASSSSSRPLRSVFACCPATRLWRPWLPAAARRAVQCSAVQCSAVQCSAVQCSARLHSAHLGLGHTKHTHTTHTTHAFVRHVHAHVQVPAATL